MYFNKTFYTKNNMKSKIFMVCLVATAFLASSCSGYLDEDPKGQLTPSTFYQSDSDIDLALNALYERVQQTQIHTNMVIPQWQGDDLTTHPASNKDAYREMDRFHVSNANKGVSAAWNAHYSVVMAANGILNNVTVQSPVSESKLKQARGNAEYWRANAYFYLVRLFGPLPLNLTNESDDYTLPLSSVEEVYAQIVADLKDAIDVLPTSYSTQPAHLNGVDIFATKYAAQATLSAVYMAMAGYPLNKGTEYYKLAAEQAKAVIDAKAFTMDSDWKQVYSYGNNYNKEVVLGIANSQVLGSWNHDSELSSCLIISSSGFGGWNDGMSEYKFWVDYPAGPRKDCVFEPQILRQSDMTLYNWYDLDADGNPIFSEYHPSFCIYTYNKDLAGPYDYTQPKYEGMTTGHYHRLIRLPEVMLWYAESAARANQDLATAKNYLKQVRARACAEPDKVNGVEIDNMSADQLAQACYEEHGWEIACNWVSLVTRRQDQFRMNTLKDNFERRKTNAPVTFTGADGKTYSVKEVIEVIAGDSWVDDMNYLPYPTNDSAKNPNLKRHSMVD